MLHSRLLAKPREKECVSKPGRKMLPISRSKRSVRPDFTFQDIDQGALWHRLRLTCTQVASLTGLSRRQVEWWRRRGYLTADSQSTDRFSGDAVTICLLIKQAIDAGYSLARAHEMATRHLASAVSGAIDRQARFESLRDRAALASLEQRLLVSHRTIELALEVIGPLVERTRP